MIKSNFNPETQIKFMCFNIFITVDKKVLNDQFYPQKSYYINGVEHFKVNGYLRTKDWINQNSVNVLGCINN